MQEKNDKKIFVVNVMITILLIILISLIYYKVGITNSKVIFNLKGEEDVYIEYGTKYKDIGYVAMLNDNDISDKIKVTSNVNTNYIGDYEVKYHLNISFLNYNKELVRKVHVIDTTKPVISVDCDDEIYINKYANFEIPKYTSIDNVDGDITNSVLVDSNVNVNEIGDYKINLKSTDSSNNETIQTIIVHVEPKYKNSYITISISNQKLEYYERDTLILSSDLVTGANNATPIGTYKVLNKSRNVNLRGANYVSFVNYWIAFKGNSYGLHDASWRNTFGGNIYTYNGSHGCVNMPYYKVQELYNLVEIGTPVYIKY